MRNSAERKRGEVQRADGRALERFTVYLPVDLATKLRVHAAGERRDLSHVIVDALERVLEPEEGESGIVYFLENPLTESVKIGKTWCLAQRLPTLLAEEPALRVVHAVPGYSKKESEVHRRFESYRIEGEWFQSSAVLSAARRGGIK